MARRPQNESNSMPCFRQNLVLISAALLLSTCSCIVHGFAFTPVSIRTKRLSQIVDHSARVFASREKDAQTESWSRSASSDASRFGVRRRVRKVLARAKNRTGIKNASETLTTKQSSSSIVAESASIGGLGGVLVDDVGTVDVALNLAQNGKQPEEQFVMAPSYSSDANGSNESEEVDAIRSDVPAAVANTEPLPFTLPVLTEEQLQVLHAGERLQEQTKMGRDGSGYVVVDVKAPEYVVWECLLDFESYTETIPTVRDVTMLTSTHLKSGYHSEKPVLPGNDARQLRHYGTPSLTRAAFTLSKFRLKIAAIHNYHPHPEGHYMDFCLDPDCTNLVLKAAKGVWYTQTNLDDRGEVSFIVVMNDVDRFTLFHDHFSHCSFTLLVSQEYTRVWLLCDLQVSRALPSFIVDYAAQRAMPRATTWLKPQVEAAASLWLKNGPPSPPGQSL